MEDATRRAASIALGWGTRRLVFITEGALQKEQHLRRRVRRQLVGGENVKESLPRVLSFPLSNSGYQTYTMASATYWK